MLREANHLDCLVLAQMGWDYHAEVGNHTSVPYCEKTSLLRTLQAVDDPNQLLLVYDKEGIKGFIWAIVGPMLPWSPEPVAMDFILYVVPGARGSMIGFRLISYYQDWAFSKGAREVRISVASGINEERTSAFYERMGFLPTGKQFNKEAT